MRYTPIMAMIVLGVFIAVATIVLIAALRRDRIPTRVDAFQRFVGVAAIASVGSSAMYLIYAATPSLPTLVLGDVGTLGGPAFVWVALRALDGRERPALATVGIAVTVLAAATVLAPLTVSIVVMSALLALFSLLISRATVRPPAKGRAGAKLLGVVSAGYAAFCIGAIIAGAVLGPASEVAQTGFGSGPATIVGIVAVIATGVACVRMTRDARRRAPEAGLPADVAAWRVSIPDYTLMSTAYGRTRTRALERALMSACREVDPAASGAGPGAVIVRSDAVDVPDAVRRRFIALAADEGIAVDEPLAVHRAE